MVWYAVYRQSDNELVSVGDSVAPDTELAANGMVARVFPDRPDGENKRWNKSTNNFDSFVRLEEDEFDLPRALDFLIGLRNGMPSRPAVQTKIDALIAQLRGIK